MDSINYQDAKTNIKTAATEIAQEVKAAAKRVKNSATAQGIKQDLKALEKDVLAPTFNTISEETAKLVNKVQPEIKQAVKEMGGDLKNLFKNAKL